MECVTGVAGWQEMLTPYFISLFLFLRVHIRHGMGLFTNYEMITDFVFVSWISWLIGLFWIIYHIVLQVHFLGCPFCLRSNQEQLLHVTTQASCHPILTILPLLLFYNMGKQCVGLTRFNILHRVAVYALIQTLRTLCYLKGNMHVLFLVTFVISHKWMWQVTHFEARLHHSIIIDV